MQAIQGNVIPRKISFEQRKAMLNFMIANEELARNKLTGVQGGILKTKKWEELAGILNSLPLGATKTPDKWARSWQDWKVDVKQKAIWLRRRAAGKQGGPIKGAPLTTLEEELMNFIGDTAVNGVTEVNDPLEERQITTVTSEHPGKDAQEESLESMASSSDASSTTPPPAKKRRASERQLEEYEERAIKSKKKMADAMSKIVSAVESFTPMSNDAMSKIASAMEMVAATSRETMQVVQSMVESVKNTVDKVEAIERRKGEPLRIADGPAVESEINYKEFHQTEIRNKTIEGEIKLEEDEEEDQCQELSDTMQQLTQEGMTSQSPTDNICSIAYELPPPSNCKDPAMESADLKESEEALKSFNFRVSAQQRLKMLEFMEKHPALVRNRFGGAHGPTIKKQLWDELAQSLNSCLTGSHKSTEKWMKSWQDWKCDTKSKQQKIRKQAGGTETLSPLTELEERLLKLLASVGMEEVRDPLEVAHASSSGIVNSQEIAEISLSFLDDWSETSSPLPGALPSTSQTPSTQPSISKEDPVWSRRKRKREENYDDDRLMSAEGRISAAEERRAAADERVAAAEERVALAEERAAAAEERVAAAEERMAAAAELEATATQKMAVSFQEIEGVVKKVADVFIKFLDQYKK